MIPKTINAILSVYSYPAIPFRILNELQRYFPDVQKTIQEIRRFREHMAMTVLEEGIYYDDKQTAVYCLHNLAADSRLRRRI